MSEFIVHNIPGSPFGRAVLATLEEKGATYRLSAVAPGTLRSPELGDAPYFVGTELSLADLLVAPQIDFLAETPEWAVVGAPHANLVAWPARVRARPSLKAWERAAEMARRPDVCR